MKTSELKGDVLDWAVAVLDGYDEGWLERNPAQLPPYSVKYDLGGPIIEREKICVGRVVDEDLWAACPEHDWDDQHFGPTFLIAAMRCFVATRLGDEVEIPEELR